MNKYLSPDELVKLAEHIGCSAAIHRSVEFKEESFFSKQGRYVNEELVNQLLQEQYGALFDHIVQHQPELQGAKEKFFHNCMTDYYLSTSFVKEFENKLKFSSTGDFFFRPSTTSYALKGAENISFLLSLMKNHGEAFPAMADFLLRELVELPGADHDSAYKLHVQEVGQAYMSELVKHPSKEKNTIMHLALLSKLTPFKQAQRKKKLKCYLSLLPKDERTYDLLMDNFSSFLPSEHDLRYSFEQALKSFPEHIQQRYQAQKETRGWSINTFHLDMSVKTQPVYDQMKARKVVLSDTNKGIFMGHLCHEVVSHIVAGIEEGISVDLIDTTKSECHLMIFFKNQESMKVIIEKLNISMKILMEVLDDCLGSNTDLSKSNLVLETLKKILSARRLQQILPNKDGKSSNRKL